jgi:hypothetical protein
MPKEKIAAKWVEKWLEHRGLAVRKGDNVDWEAFGGTTLEEVVEVKGDQRNAGAYRKQFMIALAAVAIVSHPNAKVSLALTPPYQSFVAKYAEVLHSMKVQVLWIKGENDIEAGILTDYVGRTHAANGRRNRRRNPKDILMDIDGKSVWVSPYDPRRFAKRT